MKLAEDFYHDESERMKELGVIFEEVNYATKEHVMAAIILVLDDDVVPVKGKTIGMSAIIQSGEELGFTDAKYLDDVAKHNTIFFQECLNEIERTNSIDPNQLVRKNLVASLNKLAVACNGRIFNGSDFRKHCNTLSDFKETMQAGFVDKQARAKLAYFQSIVTSQGLPKKERTRLSILSLRKAAPTLSQGEAVEMLDGHVSLRTLKTYWDCLG